MKEIKIKCDKCQIICPQNSFSSFFYMTLAPIDKRLKQVVREEQYCEEHTQEIRKFIEMMK